jgi:hypothetical protein
VARQGIFSARPESVGTRAFLGLGNGVRSIVNMVMVAARAALQSVGQRRAQLVDEDAVSGSFKLKRPARHCRKNNDNQQPCEH